MLVIFKVVLVLYSKIYQLKHVAAMGFYWMVSDIFKK